MKKPYPFEQDKKSMPASHKKMPPAEHKKAMAQKTSQKKKC